MSTISLLDVGQVDEWIYYAVLGDDEGCDQLYQVIDLALKSVHADEPLISEWEIDEACESELRLWKQRLKNKRITQDEYEEAVSEERELCKAELIEIAKETMLEDAFAACQLLLALLGNPSSDFESILISNTASNNSFMTRYEELSETGNRERLRPLLKNVDSVVRKLKSSDGLNSFDFHEDDLPYFIKMVDELSEKLICCKK